VVDEPKGLRRGSYTFRVRYEVDLVQTKELARDGAMWRLAWRAPPLTEGYDAARVFVDVPAAPTEPRAIKTGPLPDGRTPSLDEEGGEDGVVATLHRSAGRDELELVRPHVARGEAPLWALRLDPKAFPGVHAPEMRAPPPPPPEEPNRIDLAAMLAGLVAAALALGLLVRGKMSAFTAACAAAGAKARPLVPVGPGLAGICAGLLGAIGIGLQARGFPTWGAAAIVAAATFGVSRMPRDPRPARGPGRWLALKPGELPRARRGAAAWVICGMPMVALLAYLSKQLAPEAPYLVVLDALALLPILATGRAVQLPPHAARDAAPLLLRVYRRLKIDRTLKIVPWARFPTGAKEPDELRLFALPRAALPGLLGIELGVAWTRTASAWRARLEAIVRVHEASDAQARLALVAPFARPVTGRTPEERVFVLTPRLPGAGAARALVARLVRELTDRRVATADARYRGPERRLERNEKTDKMPAAA
jgi:hypothetical protein